MWPGILLLVGSLMLKHRNEQQAYNRANQIRQSMENYQRQKSAEGMAVTKDAIDKEGIANREGELEQLRQSRERSLKDTVAAAGSGPAPASHLDLPASAEREAATEAAAGRVAERTRRAIEQLSVMGATGEQTIKRNLASGRSAGYLDAANDALGNVSKAYTNDMRTVHVDPGSDLASKIGMAIGGFMIGGAAGAGEEVAGETASEAAARNAAYRSSGALGASAASTVGEGSYRQGPYGENTPPSQYEFNDRKRGYSTRLQGLWAR